MSEGVKQVVYVREFLTELGFPQPAATTIFCDSQAALQTAQHPTIKQNAKHIRVKYHNIIRVQGQGQVHFEHIPSGENDSDIFTKNLPAELFQRHRNSMMRPYPVSRSPIASSSIAYTVDSNSATDMDPN